MKQGTGNIVFLDIDGVMMPIGTHDYLHYNFSEIKKAYVQKEAAYESVAALDLAAVEFGWDVRAVNNLKLLMQTIDAQIVITSSWRVGRTLEVLKLLFDIYKLGEYICDVTMEGSSKEEEIEMYLWGYDIKNYVILDDLDMGKTFRGHFVHVKDGYLKKENIEEAVRILNLQK